MLAQLRLQFRRTDPGLLLAVTLSLFAAWAFLLRPSLPRETDAELHVFRTAELGYALRAGEVYPRWAPDFYYGYGYPIFNYYAPLTYYLANLLSLGIPGGATFGVKAVFIVAFLSAGCGAYGLGRRLLGSHAGLLAAASYLFAPFIYLVDPHLRGDLAEFFALGLSPLLFWSFLAHQASPTRGRLIAAAASVAAVILSHNLISLALFGLLGGYALWQAVFPAHPTSASPLRLLVRAATPSVLGVALAAFFWLPVALESDQVQLSNLVGPGHFDFRSHYQTWQGLFAPSLPLDLGAANPAFRFNVGLGQTALGLLGVLALITRLFRDARADPEPEATAPLARPAHLLFWPLSLAVLLFLMTRPSLFVWEALPLMPFFQFPWRLLGPSALALAVTGAASVQVLRLVPPRLEPPALAGLVLLPLVSTLPIWVPPEWDDFGPTDRLAILDFELSGLALGTTSTGDFVPRTVDVVPAPNPDLIASYRAGGWIDRVNRHTLPPDTTVDLIHQRPTSDEWTIRSRDAVVLRLYRFMFPGWRAAVDGEPVPIEVAQPEGFITVPVPAGSHTVRVWLGLTPARTAASATSLVALTVLVLVSFRLPVQANEPGPQVLAGARSLAAALLGFALIALIGGLANLFQPRSTGWMAQPAEHTIHAYLQGGVDLIGYTLPTRLGRPGEPLSLQLFWKAREPVEANYQVFVHLTSIAEHTWGQSDKLNPGDYPTTRWPLDLYVLDAHTLNIPPGTPPGEYTVRIGMWNHQTGVRQRVLASDGAVLGDSIPLPDTITVLPAVRQPGLAELPLDVIVMEELAPGVELIGAEIEPRAALDFEMGRLYVILYWRLASGTSAEHLADSLIGLRLASLDGTVASEQSGPPVDGIYPVADWQPGQVVRDVHSFWLDSSLPAGEYSVDVAWITSPESGVDQWFALAGITRLP